MLQPVARTRDLCAGFCPKHGFQIGYIISGNPRSIVGVMPNARVTDKVLACCGAVGTIVRGNFLSIDAAMPSARMGDQFVGLYTGTIIEGHLTALS